MAVFSTDSAESVEVAVPPEQDWSLAARDMVRGLDRLSADQREVLLLVVVEGLEYQDVATVLGVPIGTVMSRLSRARDALRDHMEGRVATRLRRVK
jgi:RNA polymerase sigma-70 factor (ECF subfamily)